MASAAFAVPANAATFLLTYNAPGAPTSALITITTADVLNSLGGHNILSASGTVGAQTITGLIANPNQSATATSADGLFTYNNVFYDNAPALDLQGLYFSAGSVQYNLYYNSPTTFLLYSATGGQFGANSIGTLSVAAVPEAATWCMMLMGFGLMGASLRYRGRKTAKVTYA